MTRGTVHAQAVDAQFTHLCPTASRAAHSRCLLIAHDCDLLLLRFLATHVFVRITDTLAFVRLGRTERTDFRRHLTEQLLVGTLQYDLGLYRRFRTDTFRPVSYTHLRAHETVLDLVCRLLLDKKKYHER